MYNSTNFSLIFNLFSKLNTDSVVRTEKITNIENIEEGMDRLEKFINKDVFVIKAF